jgi:hypothetical protein
MKPIEAKSEKTPMTATARELRGIDLQNSALGRRTCELLVRFGIVFLLDLGTHNLILLAVQSGDEMHGQTAHGLACYLVFCYRPKVRDSLKLRLGRRLNIRDVKSPLERDPG